MSMIISEGEKTTISPLESGVYTAISSMLIDCGVQHNEKYNKDQRKFMIIWTIMDEMITIGEKEYPRTLNKDYTWGLGEKSNTRKDLESWRGQAFTEEELKGFELVKIMNKGCQLNVIKATKNDKTYATIQAIMPLAKGMKVEPLSKIVIFDLMDDTTWGEWKEIPEWIQNKIRKALNLEEVGFAEYLKEYKPEENEQEPHQAFEPTPEGEESEDDLPF